MKPRPVLDRAYTPEQKRAVMEHILAAWLRCPDERLGQLIVNSVPDRIQGDPFYVEDFELARLCEAKARRSL